MLRRRIGQETLVPEPDGRSSLDEIVELIDWAPIERELDVVMLAIGLWSKWSGDS